MQCCSPPTHRMVGVFCKQHGRGEVLKKEIEEGSDSGFMKIARKV